jgi:glyoxylate carboligase
MRLSALNFSEKPMATTAADVLINGLLDWGVDTVFGIPGDGINGIMEALRQRQDETRAASKLTMTQSALDCVTRWNAR